MLSSLRVADHWMVLDRKLDTGQEVGGQHVGELLITDHHVC